MSDWFAEALRTYARIAVTGAPKSGKTTLCERVGDRPVIHTDDWKNRDWSEASLAVRNHVNNVPGAIVVEGVAVPRALRKGMNVDAVIWLDWKLAPLSRGQAAMGRGVLTVYQEWRQANPHAVVIIPGKATARAALPVQIYPEPADFDSDDTRRARR